MGLDKNFLRSRPVLFVLGFGLMILGISLVLAWWPDVVHLFRGTIGVLLALGGLMVLFLMNE